MEYAEYVKAVNKKRGIVDWKGAYVPIGGEIKAAASFRSAADMQYAMQRCEQRRVVVQAGGYVGGWAQWLSHRFDRVYTLEPEAINFECLLLNCKRANVHAMRAALSDSEGTQQCVFNERDYSAHWMREDKNGDTPTVTIDSLRLKYCDMIVLDCERYEEKALIGARQTIELYSPVIMYRERKGQMISPLLEGYKTIKQVAHDVVVARHG